jgi:glutamine synthetase
MNTRSSAINAVNKSLKQSISTEPKGHFHLFCSRVFDSSVQELFLPKKVQQHLAEVRVGKVRFDPAYADAIAEGVRVWASKHGATHFTHWFQPLTGSTAEKHDSFLNLNKERGAVERFRGKELLYGEPDASSFPSGGLRTTHEARGYTAWDPASDPFLWESGEGVTLCIPSLFYSWKGAALDQKIPLLRSEQKIKDSALRLLAFCKVAGERVFSTLGAEQEYFLIDRGLYLLRPDLVLTGRTILGAKPAKGQELEDHYFGAVKDRVMAFMRDFEEQALRLGIPVKTRHNEVAPAQHEVAPLFEPASLASDHNILLMEVMRQSALKQGLACLFHEKPFQGINGSGKHNNWSLGTDTGLNLLDPKENSLLFLTLLTAILKGVHEHAALLRASIASAGNDHRLGGSEAPPTILSVYLGDALEKIVQDLLSEKEPSVGSLARHIDLGLQHLPFHVADLSDRNRTSFFAFTGNKFEFRAVGASASCAFPVTVINAVVADSLALILDELSDAVKDKRDLSQERLLELSLPTLRKHLKAAQSVLFSGNAYSEEWQQEAAERKLPNIRRSFHAFDQLREKKTIRIFEQILSEQELESRFEILVEQYAKQLDIEASLLIELFRTQILPAAQRDLAGRNSPSEAQKKLVHNISARVDQSILAIDEVERLQSQTRDLGWEAKAKVFCELVAPQMEVARSHIDQLEMWVDDALWPLPKYRELLFLI